MSWQSASKVQVKSKKSNVARWLNILMRTWHLAASSVLFGGCLLLVPFSQLTIWHHLTILSGCLLIALEWRHDRHWPHRNKGIIAILHVSLALGIHLQPSLTVLFCWLIIITGGVGSHMPYQYRNWSFLHGLESNDKPQGS